MVINGKTDKTKVEWYIYTQLLNRKLYDNFWQYMKQIKVQKLRDNIHILTGILI